MRKFQKTSHPCPICHKDTERKLKNAEQEMDAERQRTKEAEELLEEYRRYGEL